MTPFTKDVGQGGTPALLLHCALAAHQAILPLAIKLPGLMATCMDLLGHGASPTPDGPNDLEANAAAAATVWQGPGWVIGHSYGAVVALRFAANHPEKVTRLILIEPVLFAAAGKGTGAAQFAKDFAPIGAAFDAGDMESAAQHFMGLWGDGTPWAKVPAPVRAYATARMGFIAESAADLEGDQTGLCAAGALEGLDCPVTLIRGSETHPIIADIHDALETRLPQARQHVIKGAGHMAPISHIDAVTEAILSDTSRT